MKKYDFGNALRTPKNNEFQFTLPPLRLHRAQILSTWKTVDSLTKSWCDKKCCRWKPTQKLRYKYVVKGIRSNKFLYCTNRLNFCSALCIYIRGCRNNNN